MVRLITPRKRNICKSYLGLLPELWLVCLLNLFNMVGYPSIFLELISLPAVWGFIINFIIFIDCEMSFD